MSRRRYFEEQRSGNGAIYHCVKTEIEPGDKIRLFNLMNKVKSDTISQDKINSVLNQLREGTAFNIHTQSPVSFSFSSTSTYRADGGNPSGNGLLNGENSTGGPYTGGNGGSGGSVDQSGDEFYAGSDGSDAPGITDGNGIYHPPGTKYGGGKGQGYTTRDFGEPTGKRNAGGGGADRNRDGGMGGESDYDEGCGIGRGNRKSGGYGGGGCGSEGTGGDGTVLIRGKRYKS